MVGQKQAYILLHQVTKIFRECWQWADEQTTKFWWRSASGIRILIRIETLVRHALAEVRVVPVLLVLLRLSVAPVRFSAPSRRGLVITGKTPELPPRLAAVYPSCLHVRASL